MTWTSLPAVMAFVVLLIAGLFADHQNSIVAEQALRVDVAKELRGRTRVEVRARRVHQQWLVSVTGV